MNDWKGGKPPHESVCGNPAADPGTGSEGAFSPSFWKSLKAIDEPYRGCVPNESHGLETTPALEHQLALLKTSPYPDYVVRSHSFYEHDMLIYLSLHVS